MAVLGRHIVIGNSDRRLWAPHGMPVEPQAFESLRTGDLVHEVPIDIKQEYCPSG